VDLRDYPEEEFQYPRIKCREHGCDNILRTSWEHGTGLCYGCNRERAGC
jgi:hypothetical protein